MNAAGVMSTIPADEVLLQSLDVPELHCDCPSTVTKTPWLLHSQVTLMEFPQGWWTRRVAQLCET